MYEEISRPIRAMENDDAPLQHLSRLHELYRDEDGLLRFNDNKDQNPIFIPGLENPTSAYEKDVLGLRERIITHFASVLPEL